ncbi:MAG: hypothetical protein KAU38_13325, partial [Desulfobacterales bacterium]|nr:hypothetical protein [Desulfobacterales bacterium]
RPQLTTLYFSLRKVISSRRILSISSLVFIFCSPLFLPKVYNEAPRSKLRGIKAEFRRSQQPAFALTSFGAVRLALLVSESRQSPEHQRPAGLGIDHRSAK